GELLRRDVLLRGRLQHLDAVLVGAGEEVNIVAIEPLETRNRVSRDQLVGESDMRCSIGVGDGRGQVVALVNCRARLVGFLTRRFGRLGFLRLLSLLGLAGCFSRFSLASLLGVLGLARLFRRLGLLRLLSFFGLAGCFSRFSLAGLLGVLGFARLFRRLDLLR